MTGHAAAVAGSPVIVDYLLPTASLLSVGIFGYIARAVRKYLKTHSEDHSSLDRITTEHSGQIAENTLAIKRMLEQRELLITQQGQRPARQPRARSPRSR